MYLNSTNPFEFIYDPYMEDANFMDVDHPDCIMIDPDHYIIPGYLPDNFMQIKNITEDTH